MLIIYYGDQHCGKEKEALHVKSGEIITATDKQLAAKLSPDALMNAAAKQEEEGRRNEILMGCVWLWYHLNTLAVISTRHLYDSRLLS